MGSREVELKQLDPAAGEAGTEFPPPEDAEARRRRRRTDAFGREPGGEVLVYESRAMRSVLETVERVAPTDATVLVSGETGSGKERVAEAIHRRSSRAGRRFVRVNCAALPEGLMESVLFGHEAGAFTGAARRTDGKFLYADGGTLLLDEIGELAPPLQAKILRVIQEMEVERVGSNEPVPVDVRIVATTNRDLAREVEDGIFRRDLFYRLSVVPMHIPPLRGRPEDVIPLARHFIALFSHRHRIPEPTLSDDAGRLLLAHPWPGNVRELKNAVERAVVLARGQSLEARDFFLEGTSETHARGETRGGTGRPRTVYEAEKEVILRTLAEHGGNRTKTAEVVGISVRTLRNKLNQYKIDEAA
jgi:DNA-binding NtrC family response regulator